MAATEYKNSFEYEFKTEVDFARKCRAIDLIVEQVTEVFKRMLPDISPETLDSIELGIEEKWLSEFLIYGMNNKGKAVVELALEVDWNKFNKWRNYSSSGGLVKIK
jgi:hypothetical protein